MLSKFLICSDFLYAVLPRNVLRKNKKRLPAGLLSVLAGSLVLCFCAVALILS